MFKKEAKEFALLFWSRSLLNSMRVYFFDLANDCVSYRYAGHSHYANIRHIKGAKDAQKANISIQVARMVRLALKEGGNNTNPKMNSHLAKAIAFAESKNLPAKSVQAMITKAANSKDSTTVLEIRGPGGSFFIINALTNDPRRLKLEVNKMFGPIGGAVLTAGGSRASFQDKGVIVAWNKDCNLDHAEEVAILAEAEEVTPLENDQYQFICEPDNLHLSASAIDGTDFEVLTKEVIPTPIVYAELSDSDLENVAGILDKIRDSSSHRNFLAEVSFEDVYDNVKWDS